MSQQKGFVPCHSKRVLYYGTAKGSCSMSQQKSLVLWHSKRVLYYGTAKSSCTMSQQKGLVLCHSKRVLYHVTVRGSCTMSWCYAKVNECCTMSRANKTCIICTVFPPTSKVWVNLNKIGQGKLWKWANFYISPKSQGSVF